MGLSSQHMPRLMCQCYEFPAEPPRSPRWTFISVLPPFPPHVREPRLRLLFAPQALGAALGANDT
eukprot:COSAG02_NODE_1180_length_14037_cov_73.962907_11_plen_65_part_00